MKVARLRPTEYPDARIVIVDDQMVNVQVLSRLLSKAGYRNISGITDPRELFAGSALDECDIILLDIHMPHIDGIGVARRIRARDPRENDRIRILVLTADISDETKLVALEAGADDFLTKPFDVSEVVLRVQNLLAIHFAYAKLSSYSADLETMVSDRTKRLQEALEEVAASREQALWIVGLTLEFRDFETKGHTDRVTDLALAIGQHMGLDDRVLRDLRWGSYLHDTGKIAIPDGVLLKPGKLTPEEYDKIKEHVLIGEKMLESAAFLPRSVLDIVRYHHERWDGRGYPDGLRGERIPFLARIFSVADVYDALTSKRPYKAPWTHEAASREIFEQRGAQFDPDIVDCFLARVKPYPRLQELA